MCVLFINLGGDAHPPEPSPIAFVSVADAADMIAGPEAVTPELFRNLPGIIDIGDIRPHQATSGKPRRLQNDLEGE